jgi:hypothetical protein
LITSGTGLLARAFNENRETIATTIFLSIYTPLYIQ